MNIRIVCVGKLKEKYWMDACSEYMKRLKPYCNAEIAEVREEKLPANASTADEIKVIEAEGRNILDRIAKSDYVIALDVRGNEKSSEEIADIMSKVSFTHSSIAIIIGGSLGLSADVKARADMKLSFGRITLPHQLARVVALEQIYRAFKINAGEAYHK
ncbi:MAG: 23S rRNA (pseudouridine(1915)-N(3))-methyltransferase RlmH [Mogibacterium sp.]|nr:23S rRNA (pseudouridine(1915)-N(3))-methyltransferase RlmH [Mogibacterium sp.]